MGFLRSSGSVDLKKIIYSDFFFIPEAAAAAARGARKIDLADDRFCMQNFVPLISFGPQRAVTRYAIANPVVHDPAAPPVGFQLNYHDGSVAYTTPSGPTFIGVYYGGDSGLYPDGSIIVNIQTANSPSLSNVITDITAATYEDPDHGGDGWVPTRVDGSSFYQQPDCYFGYSSATNFRATTGRWHHLLLSWDVSNGCSAHGNMVPVPDDNIIDSVSKMWAAFDDVNYNQGDLPAEWANDVTGTSDWGDNDIVSTTIANWAGVSGDIDDSTSSLAVSSVPSSPICIPGPPSQVYQENAGSNVTINSVKVIRKAKPLLFTGITLDTSNEANRRLFITAEGDPADVPAAAEALGKQPFIKFSNGKDFKDGRNTGSGPSFSRTGTINLSSTAPGL